MTLGALLTQAAIDRRWVGDQLDRMRVELATAQAEIRAANKTLDQILARARGGE